MAFLEIRRILKDIQPDIVSCHSSKAGFVGRLAAKSLGVKSIFTAHGWAFTDGVKTGKKVIYRCAERLSALLGDHVIAVSHFDKALALLHRIAKPNAITVIHNGMLYRACAPRAQNKVPQLCMVARFSEQKDHSTLLNTLSDMQDKRWHLNLIGSGDDSFLRADAERRGLIDRVTFHGQRDDVPEFLETQDIFLLISNWEGFPRSIIEAMRAGLPVITTRTAGIPEAVRPFQTGYIVPQANPRTLKRAINILLLDPERRQLMGANGRKDYEAHFTFDLMAQRTLNVYQSVLEKELTTQPVSQEHAVPS